MLTLSASALSKAIREKKKKLATSEPELTGTSPVPDLNAQDVWDLEKAAYVEDMTDSPKKINAAETMMNEPSDDVLQREDKSRMGRLRAYFEKMDL